MEPSFKQYMAALAGAMRQELPDVTDNRAEFLIDDLPYVFTTESSSRSIFVYAVIGSLPDGDEALAGVFAALLHAQFCFSESGPFSFGVDADNSFVLLQALVDTERVDERGFASMMDEFVKTANVWSIRLRERDSAPADGENGSEAETDGSATAGNAGDFTNFKNLMV